MVEKAHFGKPFQPEGVEEGMPGLAGTKSAGVLLERVKLCFPLAVPGGAQLMAAADEARDWFTDVNALWDEAGALFISFVC